MRHDYAVIIVVLHIVEERHAVVGLETLFIGKQNPGIGIGTLICHGNLGDIGFQSDNHRLVCHSKALHLMCRHAHYQRLACSYLMVAYTASVLQQHPYAVLLRLID